MAEQQGNAIQGSSAPQTPADPAAYWTPQRRAAAQPVPPPPARPGVEQPAGPPQAPPAEPGSHPPAPPKAAPAGAAPGGGTAPAAGGGPVASPTTYPYSTCGKLFFTQGSGDFQGSAAVVARNVILTAGHCVHSGPGGVWSTNVVFFPSYPLTGKSYAYRTVAAWQAWFANGNRAFDYGLIWVDANIGADVGNLGLLWNASTAGRVWRAVGYPAQPNPPFNGEAMDETTGSLVASTTAGVIGMNNNKMKQGSSGGSWITDFNGAPNYSNGLQSFHNSPDVEFGPYFTNDVKRLLDWISDPANRH